MGLIASYNLRSMIVRKGTAAMTAGGIAMVVAVFVMTLAIAQGFQATLVSSGSPQNAIVLRKSSTSETTSSLMRPDVPIIEAMPQIARGADGRPLASSELVVIIALPRKSDNQPANVPARGVSPRQEDAVRVSKHRTARHQIPPAQRNPLGTSRKPGSYQLRKLGRARSGEVAQEAPRRTRWVWNQGVEYPS